MPHDATIDGTNVRYYFAQGRPELYVSHLMNLASLCVFRFQEAVAAGDIAEMQVRCKDFRQIATKLDAYRRLKERSLRYGDERKHGNQSISRARKRA